jgi:hypothetical protein
MFNHASQQASLQLLLAVLLPLLLLAFAAGAQDARASVSGSCSSSCKNPPYGSAVCSPSGVCVIRCNQGYVKAGTSCIRGGQGSCACLCSAETQWMIYMHMLRQLKAVQPGGAQLEASAQAVLRYGVRYRSSPCTHNPQQQWCFAVHTQYTTTMLFCIHAYHLSHMQLLVCFCVRCRVPSWPAAADICWQSYLQSLSCKQFQAASRPAALQGMPCWKLHSRQQASQQKRAQ